jgi:hypothetical protein
MNLEKGVPERLVYMRRPARRRPARITQSELAETTAAFSFVVEKLRRFQEVVENDDYDYPYKSVIECGPLGLGRLVLSTDIDILLEDFRQIVTGQPKPRGR